jgi:hypothetical protein
MDVGEILEKKPRAMEKCQQRSVMIGGKRVEAGLDISEILLEKDGHIRVKASNWCGRAAGLSYHHDAWQLAGAISDASGNARERIAHMLLPSSNPAE